MARFGLSRGGIGLDIGTSAVRAVEIRSGNPPTVAKFGQVLLPRGAVRGGFVEDPAAVAVALRELWKRVDFRSRIVRIGVANPQVVTRILQMTSIPRDEIDGAIRYQAQDQFPIPVADAIIDFDVIEELVGAEGQPLMNVFVVAAQRGMIDAILEAVQLAKLQPVVMELNAYPLIRCLGAESVVATSSEAIVDIGARVTNVVVHESNRLRFVRSLSVGGDDLTDTLAGALAIDWDDAESLKHRAGIEVAERLTPGGLVGEVTDEELDRAADSLVPPVQRFVEEIKNSLDYYNTTADALPVGHVTLVGGGSLMGGVVDRLGMLLRVDAEFGHPLGGVQMAKVRMTPDEIAGAEAFLGVAVGLGLGVFED